MQKKSRPPIKRSARNKMMDLLAIRDHSEKEIRKKLKEREFTPEDIDKAIAFGQDNNWLPDSPEANQALAEKMANSLHRKGKGINYINNALKEKGLPAVKSDSDQELQKALSLVKTKFKVDIRELENLTREQKAKAGRFLMSRGFDMDTVRNIVYKR